jgi:hypothetical protein
MIEIKRDITDIVRHFALSIQNGRQISDAIRHLKDELTELEAEVDGTGDGRDGIVGEAIDIIACALDIIFLAEPDISNERITQIMLTKCQKWQRHYAKSVDKSHTNLTEVDAIILVD